jgi:CheY-like chemotaxis protein
MKVFIVDDYYDYACTLTDLFELEGHSARYCTNSMRAVDEALKFKPDWVVMDTRMPYKLGITIYRELNEKANFPFSAVFYSNYDKDAFADEFKTQDISDTVFIPKTDDMNDDVVNKLIPVLQAGYLQGGKRNDN